MDRRTDTPPKASPGTALITGASSGIGEAFARRLAADGYDLVLVARREARLRELAAALERGHAIRAGVLVADLAGPVDLGRVEQAVSGTGDLTLLVNSAGFVTFGTFADLDISRHLDMIGVHVIAAVRLAHAALPGMLARGRGGIINVASFGAFLPTAGNVT
jgi:short-subunit dehydrogenase